MTGWNQARADPIVWELLPRGFELAWHSVSTEPSLTDVAKGETLTTPSLITGCKQGISGLSCGYVASGCCPVAIQSPECSDVRVAGCSLRAAFRLGDQSS